MTNREAMEAGLITDHPYASFAMSEGLLQPKPQMLPSHEVPTVPVPETAWQKRQREFSTSDLAKNLGISTLQLSDPNADSAREQVGSNPIGVLLPNNPYRERAEQEILNNVESFAKDPMAVGSINLSRVGKVAPKVIEHVGNKLHEIRSIPVVDALFGEGKAGIDVLLHDTPRQIPAMGKEKAIRPAESYQANSNGTGAEINLSGDANTKLGHGVGEAIWDKFNPPGLSTKEIRTMVPKVAEVIEQSNSLFKQFPTLTEYSPKAVNEWFSEAFDEFTKNGGKTLPAPVRKLMSRVASMKDVF